MGQLGYILAASHSGSTLLAMLLGAHPEICSVGELKATSLKDPENYRCSCGSPIKQCDFWSKVRVGMQRRGIDFDITKAGTSIHEIDSPYVRRLLRPLHRSPGLETVRDTALTLSPCWRRHLKSTQTRNAALVDTLQEITGAKIVVDSSKVALRLKYLLRNPGLDIKVVRQVRDGRAVSLTYMDDWNFADASDPNLRGGGTGVRRSRKRPMSEAALEWRRSNEEAECLLAGLDRSQFLQVQYEQVCQDTEGTLRKITEFLGVDPNKIVKNFRSVEQHVVGNGMRLDKSSAIQVDERWKTHLSADDLKTFDQIAGDLNRRYGYV